MQTSVMKIPPSEKTESSVQRKISPNPNNKAPDIVKKLVRHKSKARINVQVPENTYKQSKKSEPLDLIADKKKGQSNLPQPIVNYYFNSGGPYLFNWKKKRRDWKPKPKAAKKIKKITLFG